MTQEKYLYAIMHPNRALVASMLSPEDFGRHYTVGSSRYFHGQVIYAEVDSEFRNDYLPIEQSLEELKPKPDGSPKRTKFVKSYRVLEHLELSAIKELYVTSSVGKVLRLEKAPYTREHKAGFLRTFQEICPLSMIVLSYMDPRQFGEYVTKSESKGAPKLFFTQIDLNIEQFLSDLEHDSFMTSPLPNVHPHKLREQILELRAHPRKGVKGISLDSVLGRISFLRLRTGFWVAAQDDLIFYPIPTRDVLEHDHYEWYRSLSQ